MQEDTAHDVKEVFERWDTVSINRANPMPSQAAAGSESIPTEQRFEVTATRVIYSDDFNMGQHDHSAAKLRLRDPGDVLPKNANIEFSFDPITTPHDEAAIRLHATVTTPYNGDPLPDEEQDILDLYLALDRTITHNSDTAARVALTFKSLDELENVSFDDLTDIDGVGKKTAEKIQQRV